jgi:hypothetical protein
MSPERKREREDPEEEKKIRNKVVASPSPYSNSVSVWLPPHLWLDPKQTQSKVYRLVLEFTRAKHCFIKYTLILQTTKIDRQAE